MKGLNYKKGNSSLNICLSSMPEDIFSDIGYQNVDTRSELTKHFFFFSIQADNSSRQDDKREGETVLEAPIQCLASG